jgi:hypothetical protein
MVPNLRTAFSSWPVPENGDGKSDKEDTSWVALATAPQFPAIQYSTSILRLSPPSVGRLGDGEVQRGLQHRPLFIVNFLSTMHSC